MGDFETQVAEMDVPTIFLIIVIKQIRTNFSIFFLTEFQSVPRILVEILDGHFLDKVNHFLESGTFLVQAFLGGDNFS